MDVIPPRPPQVGQRRSRNGAQADRRGFFCWVSSAFAGTVDGVEESGYVWEEYELVLVVGAEGCEYDYGAWDEAAACELNLLVLLMPRDIG